MKTRHLVILKDGYYEETMNSTVVKREPVPTHIDAVGFASAAALAYGATFVDRRATA